MRPGTLNEAGADRSEKVRRLIYDVSVVKLRTSRFEIVRIPGIDSQELSLTSILRWLDFTFSL